MSVLEKIASALGRRDDGPNIALARELAAVTRREATKASSIRL